MLQKQARLALRTFDEDVHAASGGCVSSDGFRCIFAEINARVFDRMHHSLGIKIKYCKMGGGPHIGIGESVRTLQQLELSFRTA